MGYNKKQRLSQWRNSTEVFVDSEKNWKWYDICFQYYGVLTLLQMSNSSSGTSLSSLPKSIFCNNIMIFHQTKWAIQVMQGCTVFANPRSVVGQFSFDGEGSVGAMP